MATIPLIQLVVTVAVGVAFPTLIALVGIMVNNGRFNTQRCKDGRLLHIESSLGMYASAWPKWKKDSR